MIFFGLPTEKIMWFYTSGSPKAVKKLAGSWDILVTEALCREIASHFGQQNVKVVEKSIENLGKMN